MEKNIKKRRQASKKKAQRYEIIEQPEEQKKSIFSRLVQWAQQKFSKSSPPQEKNIELVEKVDIADAEPSRSAEERISAIIECITEWKEKQKRKTTIPHPIKQTALQKKVDDIGREASVLNKMEIHVQDGMKLIQKHAGNPHVLLVCDPPYWDCLGYGISFGFELHKEMAKLLQKHAKAGGCFLYFGRPTAPRSLNTDAGIDYLKRDEVYEGKFNELFSGKGFFYKDYVYDKSHGVIERVVSNLALEGFSLYDK